MKKAIGLVLLSGAFCCALFGTDAMARTNSPVYSETTDKASLEDAADILTDEEETRLLEKAAEVSDQTGSEIRLLTIDDAEGKDTAQVAMDYFAELTDDPEASGACYLIDMDNRAFQIEVTGELRYYLTDSRVDDLLDRAYEYAPDGEYEKVFDSMLEDTESDFEKGPVDGAYMYDPQTGDKVYYNKPKAVSALELAVSILLGAAAFCGVFYTVRLSYGMKLPEPDDYSVEDNLHLKLSRSEDTFVNKIVTTRPVPRDNGSSDGPGSGGVSSTSNGSSGGHSFSGGGRSF